MKPKKSVKPMARTSPGGHKIVMDIAKQLFERYQDQHKAVGIRQPSAKVAIDYLIVRASMNSTLKFPEISARNNVWIHMATVDMEEV